MNTVSPDPSEGERLNNVESLLSHLQHDVDKLNEALIEQQTQIDRLRQLVTKVQSVVDHLPEEQRDLQDERPPHY